MRKLLFIKQVMTEHQSPPVDEEQRVQHELLRILSNGLQESRYAVFEYAIKEYEANCYERAREQIHASNKSNKLDALANLARLYEHHVKNYAKQNRQAILDNQIAEPIARNAGVAVNALCHQMHGFAL